MSKTVEQLQELARKMEAWRPNHPWVSMGAHGIICDVCKRAGIKSKWATGRGVLERFYITYITHFTCELVSYGFIVYCCTKGGRGRAPVFSHHLKQHAQSRVHRLAATWLNSIA